MEEKDTTLAVAEKTPKAVSTKKPKSKIKKRIYRIFDWKYAQQAIRMKAAGLPEDFIAWALFEGDRYTLKHWKKHHPEFKKGMDEAKDAQAAVLMYRGLRAAAGYRYEEENEKWVVAGTDKNGKPKYVLKSKSVFKKEQHPDPKLLQWFLAFHGPPEFRQLYCRRDSTNQSQVHLHINGQVVSNLIDKMAGKYLLGEPQDAKEVENETNENND